MVVSERYPDLKANQGFRDLRVQLEGTENRITVARNRYIQTVQEYNVLARSFPTNLTAMVFGYEPKPNFTVQNEAQISTPPQVDFGNAEEVGADGRRACTAARIAARPAAAAAVRGSRCGRAGAGRAARAAARRPASSTRPARSTPSSARGWRTSWRPSSRRRARRSSC